MTRVIIDAGHGGTARAGSSSAFGSRGPGGTLEKEVTLDIARHVVARLGPGAALTRVADTNLTLGARAQLAAQRDADVFVSIHANSGPPEASGPETFVHYVILIGGIGPTARSTPEGSPIKITVTNPGPYGGVMFPCWSYGDFRPGCYAASTETFVSNFYGAIVAEMPTT